MESWNKALAQAQLPARWFFFIFLSLSMFGENVVPFICSTIPPNTPNQRIYMHNPAKRQISNNRISNPKTRDTGRTIGKHLRSMKFWDIGHVLYSTRQAKTKIYTNHAAYGMLFIYLFCARV
jgi:hypothetical protein